MRPSGKAGEGKARHELAVDHAADEPETQPNAGHGTDGSDVLAVPLLPLLPEDFHGDNESHANARPDGVHHAHFKAFDVESEGMQGETQCREDDHRKRRRRIDSGSIASIATPMRKP